MQIDQNVRPETTQILENTEVNLHELGPGKVSKDMKPTAWATTERIR